MGKFMKTTNGGVNWFSDPLISDYITNIYFYNDQVGCLLPESDDSTIIRTTNGGLNWIRNKIPFSTPYKCMKFYDKNTGYIFGGYDSKQIIKTTNGGQNWFFLSSGIFKDINSIYFTDANFGWAVGGIDNYLRTTNGGNDWYLQYLNVQGAYPINDIYFKDQQTGWLLTSHSILKTTNSGMNWATLYDTAFYGNTLGPYFSFKNENEIFIPRVYCIFKSTNGGLDWFRQYINNENLSISTIKFFSESNGWLICRHPYADSSRIFKSSDGGNSWVENLRTGTDAANLYFLNSNTGWITAAKDPSYTIKNLVYKTTNGGLNWTSYIHPDTIPASFDKIYFENENTGICIGWNFVHKTTNGGINWNSYCMLTEDFSSMYFLNPQTGWISGNYGTILKTTTGSATFVNNINNRSVKNYMLYQNFPNPFNPTTVISYSLLVNSFVTLKVYDILGREVETLVNEFKKAGTYEIQFPNNQYTNNQLPSGIYFYTLTAGEFKETKKLILLK